MKSSRLKGDVQTWLIGLSRDPMTKTLRKRSTLTKIQLETFLIDVLSEKIGGRKIPYDEKASLRIVKSGVSRGAFNRTLAQAKKNIIGSIYTLILLGYLGVFESPALSPYVEIANKIRAYAEAYKGLGGSAEASREYLRIISVLQKEIEKGLEELSEPKAMSSKT